MDAFLDKRLTFRIQQLLQPATHLGAGQTAAIKDLMPTKFPWIGVVCLLLGIVFFCLSRVIT